LRADGAEEEKGAKNERAGRQSVHAVVLPVWLLTSTAGLYIFRVTAAGWSEVERLVVLR